MVVVGFPLSSFSTIPVLLLLINLFSLIPRDKLYTWFFVFVTYILSCAALEVDLSPELQQYLAGLQVPSALVLLLLFIEDWIRFY